MSLFDDTSENVSEYYTEHISVQTENSSNCTSQRHWYLKIDIRYLGLAMGGEKDSVHSYHNIDG